jgi:hypothetical protein
VVAVEIAGAVVLVCVVLALARAIIGRARPAVRTGSDVVGRVDNPSHVLIMPFGEVFHIAAGRRTTPDLSTDGRGPSSVGPSAPVITT